MYFRIKRSIFAEIALTSIFGMLICLCVVFYLLEQIRTLEGLINDLKDREPIVITKIIETEIQTEETEEKIENSTIKISDEDRQLLAKLLYCEGRGESIECQRAIVSVVINRLNNGYWGSTIKDVIYAQGQFEPVSTGALSKAKPSQTQYDVIDFVIKNGSTLPEWVQFFRAGYHFKWKGYTQYCNIDNTYFGGYEK